MGFLLLFLRFPLHNLVVTFCWAEIFSIQLCLKLEWDTTWNVTKHLVVWPCPLTVSSGWMLCASVALYCSVAKDLTSCLQYTPKGSLGDISVVLGFRMQRTTHTGPALSCAYVSGSCNMDLLQRYRTVLVLLCSLLVLWNASLFLS